MNLIDRIARLQALDLSWSEEDYEQIVEMLPGMFGILSEIQPGDAEILAEWLYQIEEEYGEDGADPKDQPITKLLRRYHAMAKRMEAKTNETN